MFFFPRRFNLSPIIHNTQFRRLTKPPSVCWYRPPPSSETGFPIIGVLFPRLINLIELHRIGRQTDSRNCSEDFKTWQGHEKSAATSSIKKSDRRPAESTRRDYFSPTRGLISLSRFFSPHNFLRQWYIYIHIYTHLIEIAFTRLPRCRVRITTLFTPHGLLPLI